MIYSVWNNREKLYDLYKGSKVAETHSGPPEIALGDNPVANEVGAKLPAGATFVGTSFEAHGKICSLAGDDSGAGLSTLIILAVAVWGVLK